jgi:hypothetical protein
MSSRSSSIVGASAALAAAAVVLILAAPGRGLAAAQCARYAGTPQKQTSGGDFSHDGVETIYAAAQAYYCPDGAAVQITECLQRLGDDGGWVDEACRESNRVRVTRFMRVGRGVAVATEVPCTPGTWRTRVTGTVMDGGPQEWGLASQEIVCSTEDQG